MKSFRLQTLLYEFVLTTHKKKMLCFFKSLKILYPFEFLWFREYNNARILVRLKLTNSYKLAL